MINEIVKQDSEKVITTTVGDLICAICDAAKESEISESDVAKVTQVILEAINKQK